MSALQATILILLASVMAAPPKPIPAPAADSELTRLRDEIEDKNRSEHSTYPYPALNPARNTTA